MGDRAKLHTIFKHLTTSLIGSMKEKNRHSLSILRRYLSGFSNVLWALVVFCFINIAIYVLLSIWPNLLNYLWLNKDNPLGIVSAIFTHPTPIHLVYNLIGFGAWSGFFILFSQTKSKMTRIRWGRGFILLSLGAGVCAYLFEYPIYFFITRGPTSGASGMVYGALGVLLAKLLLNTPANIQNILYVIRNRSVKKGDLTFPTLKRKRDEVQLNLFSLVTLVAILGYIFIDTAGFLNVAPHVDVVAHGVGLLVGLFGFQLLFRRDFIGKQNH